ncbi:hypothetical protein FK178_12060 [Antarcticibacterium arcticum]|uniref:Uncharacterized protein n=1 Tax=Antarcticibacterium arcticum TaxID=2585771 RepID=A0A5B8YP60_9FLAO|nr:hypothetical protein [Antarcticibacterium arcticum]QED38403.1 hypothetical protein FK178_12060 [Antarcticibacterium arcticum]
MKLISPYISGLLGLIIIAATLLQSIHELSHNIAADDFSGEMTINPVALDCDLCDFHFSSVDLPEHNNHNLYLPFKESVYSISITATVYPFTHNLFSLRAPPAVIA